MKLDKSVFAAGKKPVTIQNGKETVDLEVRELGYLQTVALSTDKEPGFNFMAAMLAESVYDSEGKKAFTYEEILQLRRETANPLFEAVIELNKLGATEKN